MDFHTERKRRGVSGTNSKNIANQSVDFGANERSGFFSKDVFMQHPGQAMGNILDELNSQSQINKEDLFPNPPSGYKKMVLPTLRDRNRQLLSGKIIMQNEHVNKVHRRYIN